MDKWPETTKIESHRYLIILYPVLFYLNLIGNSY